MKTACVAAIFLIFSTLGVGAKTLRIGTWNIANLHHEIGVPLRPGAEARDADDFERLRSFAASLNLDIAALQEIGSPAALERVFPKSDYHLIMSKGYKAGDETRAASVRDIHTAFAIRKSTFLTLPEIESVEGLNVTHIGVDKDHNPINRSTRDSMVLNLRIGDRDTKLLNVHLKSFCHVNSLKPVFDTRQDGQVNANRYDCRTLVAQAMILENWVEQQIEIGNSIIVLGDINRQLNRFHQSNRSDQFWMMLNDGGPNGLTLHKGPTGKNTTCWSKPHELFHDEHIEFVIFDGSLDRWLRESAISKIPIPFQNEPKYAGRKGQKLSDHCPIVFEIQD